MYGVPTQNLKVRDFLKSPFYPIITPFSRWSKFTLFMGVSFR